MIGRVGKSALLAGAVIVLSATEAGLAASASVGEGDAPHSHGEGRYAARLLAAHNAERASLDLPQLKWNRDLAREADEWARELARKGRLEHASREVRNGTGENLWMGTAGVWDIETMVGMFLSERENYRHQAFPDVSRTGNWADVAHYTQIVWRDTKEVGCAVVTERGNDVLVCRYWPAGNVWGAKAY